jgi:hypothetical protein
MFFANQYIGEYHQLCEKYSVHWFCSYHMLPLGFSTQPSWKSSQLRSQAVDRDSAAILKAFKVSSMAPCKDMINQGTNIQYSSLLKCSSLPREQGKFSTPMLLGHNRKWYFPLYLGPLWYGTLLTWTGMVYPGEERTIGGPCTVHPLGWIHHDLEPRAMTSPWRHHRSPERINA